MPWPVSSYQDLPLGSRFAFFQSAFSSLSVPESSPRLMKAAPLSKILVSASARRGRALDARGVARWAQQDEVVVHDEAAVHAHALVDDLLLGAGRVHEHDVGVAALAHRQRLAGADGDDLDVVAAVLLEHGHQDVEQAGVLRARRRRQDDVLGAFRGRRVWLSPPPLCPMVVLRGCAGLVAWLVDWRCRLSWSPPSIRCHCRRPCRPNDSSNATMSIPNRNLFICALPGSVMLTIA